MSYVWSPTIIAVYNVAFRLNVCYSYVYLTRIYKHAVLNKAHTHHWQEGIIVSIKVCWRHVSQLGRQLGSHIWDEQYLLHHPSSCSIVLLFKSGLMQNFILKPYAFYSFTLNVLFKWKTYYSFNQSTLTVPTLGWRWFSHTTCTPMRPFIESVLNNIVN